MSSEEIGVADAFRRLQLHLNTMPVGYPATESGVEIRLLKRLFTPEEAEIAGVLSFAPESAKKVARRAKKLGLSEEEVSQRLDAMVAKGVIHGGQNTDTGEMLYGAAPLLVGFFNYQAGHLTADLVADFDEYADTAFFDAEWVKTLPQLRTIPAEQSIKVNQVVEWRNEVAAYDDISKLVENARPPYVVLDCTCRQMKEIEGTPCTHSREVCLRFASGARWYLSLGIGREISKEEVVAILQKAQEEGLILQPYNAQRPIGICCCCGDACLILTRLKKYPRPADLVASNYYVQTETDKCTGCGACMDRCQMDAIELEGVSRTNLERCIGCGACVPTCPENARHLVKKEVEWVPTVKAEELYMEIMKQKAKLATQSNERKFTP
ncbi:MAG TPA: 4Fe-4S binding protein [Candidatus Lokiarchaeia archaeon]|nr:4Fe-4S binding protein [Candidatus Lokiarchaeia archaeon]